MTAHYNSFTIGYINILRDCLRIETDSKGNHIFLPELIAEEDVIKLKTRLSELWEESQHSLEVVSNRVDTQLQSCLFGAVDDLELALKTGFLIGDRVILLDFLYERILVKKTPAKINLALLGSLASQLVNCLDLASSGRLVIIPHPLSWNEETKKFIEKSGDSLELTPDLMSILSVLSIAEKCKFQPFTIAESKEEYNKVVKEKLEATTLVRRDEGENAYKAILSGLMSERLLTETKFNMLMNLPLADYAKIVADKRSFYLKLRNKFTEGNAFHADLIFDEFSKKLVNEIIENDQSENHKLNKFLGDSAGVIGPGLSLAALALTAGSTTLKIIGGLLSVGSKVSGLFKGKESEDKIIVAVFRKLYNNS
ncbi:hypothetical protein [Pedobacter sp. D749]|uniref:hypothetical protein n=1 Tax=Pedobacter sp. D749 TaxID=2856523 RepID=UPI001C58FAC0|nr:hypothetical protein [Pedobacter sp. D749]QXU41469.1 hypothetical protein KYH19_21095 [Pedobacter sp. D749]